MPTITEQIRELHNQPQAELEDRREAIKAQIERQRAVGETGDEAATLLVAGLNNECARIRHGQGVSDGADRNPLQALPVIDGPFKGMALRTQPIISTWRGLMPRA